MCGRDGGGKKGNASAPRQRSGTPEELKAMLRPPVFMRYLNECFFERKRKCNCFNSLGRSVSSDSGTGGAAYFRVKKRRLSVLEISIPDVSLKTSHCQWFPWKKTSSKILKGVAFIFGQLPAPWIFSNFFYRKLFVKLYYIYSSINLHSNASVVFLKISEINCWHSYTIIFDVDCVSKAFDFKYSQKENLAL